MERKVKGVLKIESGGGTSPGVRGKGNNRQRVQ